MGSERQQGIEPDILGALPDAHFLVDGKGRVTRYLGGGRSDKTLDAPSLEGATLADRWPQASASKIVQAVKRIAKTRQQHAVVVDIDDRRYEARIVPKGRREQLLILRSIDGDAPVASSARSDLQDDVTGLTARDSFMGMLDDALADAGLRERGLAVLCLDINNFTRINDTLGRAIGDAVLRVTARRIERCLRDDDQLARIDDSGNSNHLTRISGDEFVLLLGDVESRRDAATVADRLGAAFVEPVVIEGHQVAVSPCIGISQFPVDGDSAEELVQNARVALGEAKLSEEKGKAFFSSTMKFRAAKKLDISEELRWAMENDQLEMHYLPRIDLATGEVAGLEALLRWIHPLRGSVPLSEVIPLAEATGLILDIGEWCLATVCAQGRAWIDEIDEAPPVSVNIGESEFKREDLPSLVEEALKAHDLPRGHLEIELPEKLLSRSQRASAVLGAIDKLGIGVVIDDFGSSLSSIAHLTELPVKGIKIDRSFVAGACSESASQNTCAAIIAMAGKLGISVIAEGVENAMQAEFLRDNGCDAVQGFFYTKPLPADRVPDFIAACRHAAMESMVVDLTTMRLRISAEAAVQP